MSFFTILALIIYEFVSLLVGFRSTFCSFSAALFNDLSQFRLDNISHFMIDEKVFSNNNGIPIIKSFMAFSRHVNSFYEKQDSNNLSRIGETILALIPSVSFTDLLTVSNTVKISLERLVDPQKLEKSIYGSPWIDMSLLIFQNIFQKDEFLPWIQSSNENVTFICNILQLVFYLFTYIIIFSEYSSTL